MTRRTIALLASALATLWLIGCAAAPETGDRTTLPEIPGGKSRLYVLREHSIFQAPVDATFELNGVTVARLANSDFTYVDVPAGDYYFVVSGLPNSGAWRSGLKLEEKQARYLLISPNKRPDEERSLFRDSRRFDWDGGTFIVHLLNTVTGAETVHHMRYTRPLSDNVSPIPG